MLSELKAELARLEKASAHAKAHPETGMPLLEQEMIRNLRQQVEALEGLVGGGKAGRSRIVELTTALEVATRRAERAEAEMERLTNELAASVRPGAPLYPLVSDSEDGGLDG